MGIPISEVDWKSDKQLGPDGADQWCEVYLEASN